MLPERGHALIPAVLRQHGIADNAAVVVAVCVPDESAVAQPVDTAVGQPVAQAFNEPDRKSFDIAEPFTISIACAEPVGVSERPSFVEPVKLTVDGAVGIADRASELKPKHDPEPIAFAFAVAESVLVPEQLSFVGTERQSFVVAQPKPVFFAERKPKRGTDAQPDRGRAVWGAHALRRARVHGRHVLPERDHGRVPAMLRQHGGADSATVFVAVVKPECDAERPAVDVAELVAQHRADSGAVRLSVAASNTSAEHLAIGAPDASPDGCELQRRHSERARDVGGLRRRRLRAVRDGQKLRC